MTAGTSNFFNIFSEKDPSLNDAEQFVIDIVFLKTGNIVTTFGKIVCKKSPESKRLKLVQTFPLTNLIFV